MATLEELEAENSRLKGELATTKRDLTTHQTDLGKAQETVTDLRGRLKEVNDESKGHRLNAENFRRSADDLKVQLDEATAKAITLGEQHQTALTAVRGEHTTTLEALRTELTGKVAEAETKVTETLTKAQQRALKADLRVAATNAGMLDLDGLKLIDDGKIELDDEGNLKNGEALMTSLKEGKAYLFTKEAPPAPKPPASTGNPNPPPSPKDPKPKSARDLSEAEWNRAIDHINATGQLPA